MKLSMLPSLCRAGTENMRNPSGKNYLKYLKYLKANVSNEDTHPLQGFRQYALSGTFPLFPLTPVKSGEKDKQHNQTPTFKYHLCGPQGSNYTPLSPLSSRSASSQRGNPHRRITRTGVTRHQNETQLHSFSSGKFCHLLIWHLSITLAADKAKQKTTTRA